MKDSISSVESLVCPPIQCKSWGFYGIGRYLEKRVLVGGRKTRYDDVIVASVIHTHTHSRSTESMIVEVAVQFCKLKAVQIMAGLSGNSMIYHRYVTTLQLWYKKQSNYMSLLIYITLDTIHPFFLGTPRNTAALGIGWRSENPISHLPPAPGATKPCVDRMK